MSALDLTLSFEPQAIRDHFGDEQSDVAEWVREATDEQLTAVAEECLGGDVVYAAFHASLTLAVEHRTGA